MVVNIVVNYSCTRVLLHAKMLKKTEKTIGFLSLVTFQLGGASPLATPMILTDLSNYCFAVGYRSKFAGTPKTKSRVKSELRNPLDILKQRKVKEKNKLKYQLGKQRRKDKKEKALKRSKKKGRSKRV